MHASESLRIFVVRGQIAQSAQPFSKSYSIEERPVQTRSTPAITTTRSIWRPFLGRAQDIHQRHARREAACAGEAVESSADQMALRVPYHCANPGKGRRHREGVMEDRHPSCTAVVSLAVVLISSVTAVAHTHAQTAPAFETTSIRRNPPRDALPIAVVRGDRFFAPSTTVRDLIRVANLVEEIQISGGPSVDRVGALRDRSVNRSRRQP